MKLASWIERYVYLCTSLSPLWVISTMTLVSMVRYGEGMWYFNIVSAIFLSLVCLFPIIIQKEQFWFTVCMLSGLSLIFMWDFIGSHNFLLFYWSFALFLSCFATNRSVMLSQSARWVLGSLFLSAFIWKLVSRDFNSGATMQYFLSSTLPLGDVAVALTELTGPQLSQNISAVDRVLSSSIASQTTLITPNGLRQLANFITLATQITEGTLVLIFLAPLSVRWRWLREAGLLFFFITAYTLIPVASFGTQMACLGFALTRSDRFRAAFIAAFFAFQVMDLRLGGVWGQPK